MKKAIRLIVEGSIMSRFYNQFIKARADDLMVKGFVRTKESGETEIFAEGQEEQITQFIAQAKQGPQHSSIRRFEQKEEKVQEFKEFKIYSF